MLEWSQRERGRICIACVADHHAPLAAPELAGATAVLRTLLLEAHLDWTWHSDHMFKDARRQEAVLDTAEAVLWWVTPPNHRTGNPVRLREETIVDILAQFDRMWICRSTVQPLKAIYDAHRVSQAKALHHAELAAVDRKYAELVATEIA